MNTLASFVVLLCACATLGAAQECTVSEGYDIDLDNLDSYDGRDRSECCGLCANYGGCRAWAWNDYEGGTCWLKGGTGPLVPATGVSAGSLEGSGGDEKKVICYFTNWATYRAGISKYDPSDIDPSVCTNIIYSFAELDAGNLEIKVQDTETDINQGFYEQVTGLKSQGLTVSIAIGGWGDSSGDKYSRMVSSSSSRANFVRTAVEFLQRHNFDGLDLDWEYPRCWVGNCDAGPPSDKENFARLISELRTAFDPHGFVLSAAVSASRDIGDNAYDIPTMSANLNWIGLMTYDYHGGYDGVTGHNSPFKGQPPSSEDTINYWLSKGASPGKLVLGVPLYGLSFTLDNPNNNGVGAGASDGAPGQYTEEDGFLAYFELCSGWTKKNVPNVGPYAYKGNQWASFDDVAIIEQKADYIRQQGLAGAMVWAIDTDDFNGQFCGQGSYPLLKALRGALSKV